MAACRYVQQVFNAISIDWALSTWKSLPLPASGHAGEEALPLLLETAHHFAHFCRMFTNTSRCERAARAEVVKVLSE